MPGLTTTQGGDHEGPGEGQERGGHPDDPRVRGTEALEAVEQLADQTQVELELSEQRNPSISEHHVAEATIFAKGLTLRAREASPDIRASIDQLVDKLERQVKRYREMRRVEPRRHGAEGGSPTNNAA